MHRPDDERIRTNLGDLFDGLGDAPDRLSEVFASMRGHHHHRDRGIVECAQTGIGPIRMQAGRPVERVDAGVAGDEDAFGVDPSRIRFAWLAGVGARWNAAIREISCRLSSSGTATGCHGAQTGFDMDHRKFASDGCQCGGHGRRRVPVHQRQRRIRTARVLSGTEQSRSVAPFRAAAQIGEQLIEGIHAIAHQTVDGVVRPADPQVDVGVMPAASRMGRTMSACCPVFTTKGCNRLDCRSACTTGSILIVSGLVPMTTRHRTRSGGDSGRGRAGSGRPCGRYR